MDLLFERLQAAKQRIQEAKAKISASLGSSYNNHNGTGYGPLLPNGDFIRPTDLGNISHVNGPSSVETAGLGSPTIPSGHTTLSPDVVWDDFADFENISHVNGPSSVETVGLGSSTIPSGNSTISPDVVWDDFANSENISHVNGPNSVENVDFGNPQPDGLDDYDGPQSGELYPDEPGDGLDDYHGPQGGQIGTIPDNASGGPNSTTTGQITTSDSATTLDDHTLDGVANTDSSSAGTLHTESTTGGLSASAVLVSGSATLTDTTSEQVTHNADGTTVVSSQTDSQATLGVGGSVIVAGADVSGGFTDTQIIENSGPTDVVQESIENNGGLIDTSDVSAIPEGMTVTEIGDPDFDILGSGETASGSISGGGVSADAGINGVSAGATLDQSTGTITETSQSGLDTTTVTNTGDSIIVGTGETSIQSTEFTVEGNQTGTSVGGVGTITGDTVSITNSTQQTETFDIEHDHSTNGINAAQQQADSGNPVLGSDGSYDHTVQTTSTHTETMTQGAMQGSAQGGNLTGNHSDGNPVVTNQEVEQQTTTTHMQGTPGSTPDPDLGFFDFTDSDTELGTSTNHSITESPQNGDPGFAVEQSSEFHAPMNAPVETVTASTSDGVTIEGTPEEIQADAQEALQSHPDNPVLQDLADGVPLPDAVHNDANTGFENITIGHDNANTTEALEAIAEEQALQDNSTSGTGTGSGGSGGGGADSGSGGSGGGGADSGSGGSGGGGADSGSGGSGGGGADSGSGGSGGGGADSGSGGSGGGGADSGSGGSGGGGADSGSGGSGGGGADSGSGGSGGGGADSGSGGSGGGGADSGSDGSGGGGADSGSGGGGADSGSGGSGGGGSDDDGGCFLTTSACEHRGLSDDCHELTVLRGFRDTWMHATPDLQEQVKEYYRVAPAVVQAIEALPDRTIILESMFTEYIRPSVEAIERGENDMAYDIYVKMLRDVQDLTA